MLELTKNATEVIGRLIDRPGLPQGTGLRISASPGTEGHLAISTAVTPEDADRVIEEEDARVFLDPMAADVLDDKVLDALVNDDGNVQFLVAAQT